MNQSLNLSLSNHLCFSIYACSREMIKLYNPLLKELEITYPQYLVLLVLWEHKKRTVKQLGEELFLDSGTLTPLLKRLEEAEIVNRTRSKEDERIVEITLTNKGIGLENQAKEIPIKLFEKTGLDVDEFNELNNQFRGLLKKLQK